MPVGGVIGKCSGRLSSQGCVTFRLHFQTLTCMPISTTRSVGIWK